MVEDLRFWNSVGWIGVGLLLVLERAWISVTFYSEYKKRRGGNQLETVFSPTELGNQDYPNFYRDDLFTPLCRCHHIKSDGEALVQRYFLSEPQPNRGLASQPGSIKRPL